MTLMGFVAGVVRERYPNVLEFVNEVTYLEKAATGETINSATQMAGENFSKCLEKLLLYICKIFRADNPRVARSKMPAKTIVLVTHFSVSDILHNMFTFSPISVSLQLLGVDIRQMSKGLKEATRELVENKHNKKLKVSPLLLYSAPELTITKYGSIGMTYVVLHYRP